MVFDLDPFADILPEPASSNARAGGKFQPKVKPRLRKETSVTHPTSLPIVSKEKCVTTASGLYDATKEHPIITPATLQDTTESVSSFLYPAERESTHPAFSSVDTTIIKPCTTTLEDPSSKLLGIKELVNESEASHPGMLLSVGIGGSEPVDPLTQTAVTTGDVDSTGALHSEVVILETHLGLQSSFERFGGETADIFSELESLGDILSKSTSATVNTVNKFHPEVKVNARPGNKVVMLHSVSPNEGGLISSLEVPILQGSGTRDLEERLTLPVLSSVNSSTFRAYSIAPNDMSCEVLVSKEPVNSREDVVHIDNVDLRMDSGRSEREEQQASPGLETVDIFPKATTTCMESVSCPRDAQSNPPEVEYLDEGSPAIPPDGFLDFSTISLSDSAPADPPVELPGTEGLMHPPGASRSFAANPEKVVDSQSVPGMSVRETRKIKTSTVSEETARKVHSQNFEELSHHAQDERPVSAAAFENEARKSSRQLRKRKTVCIPADEIEDGIHENGNVSNEPSINSDMDDYEYNNDDDDIDDDDEYRGEDTSRKRRAPRKSKKHAAKNEKPVRRCKKASEGPATLNKEPPKKFSHSTRRNRRRVDKVLLETPEDEINPQQLIIKDLIKLAEAKERISNKEAAALKKAFPNQSANSSFPHDAPYDEEGLFASMRGLNSDDDEEAPKVHLSSSKLNYHSFMDRTPSERWSKQDTELFYEAIRQFGTDFAMIQQLFPGRTRHQVKLKYKKEERQHPLRLSDALSNRSKDHSHFEVVIERLRQASAQTEQTSDRDVESVGLTGEEEVAPEKNEEVTKSEQHEEVVKDLEQEIPEVHSPVKSHESEDDIYRWSQYKSADYHYPEDTENDDSKFY